MLPATAAHFISTIWYGATFGRYWRKAGMKWQGWHAFRRGLATNLQRLGVPIKVAQLLLRQADFATAANYYVKVVDGREGRHAASGSPV
ncbi:MAG TPA: hypothetical protein VMI10_02515 [Terriglobales bacterium]|nr:hypothetical protein [Terriglobales bacterium]